MPDVQPCLPPGVRPHDVGGSGPPCCTRGASDAALASQVIAAIEHAWGMPSRAASRRDDWHRPRTLPCGFIIVDHPTKSFPLIGLSDLGMVYPRTVYTDLNALRFLGAFGDKDSRGQESMGPGPE